jgi:hypothetical protein
MQVCAPTDTDGPRGVSVVSTRELTGDKDYDISRSFLAGRNIYETYPEPGRHLPPMGGGRDLYVRS